MTPQMTTFGARNGRLSCNFGGRAGASPPTVQYSTILHPAPLVIHLPVIFSQFLVFLASQQTLLGLYCPHVLESPTGYSKLPRAQLGEGRTTAGEAQAKAPDRTTRLISWLPHYYLRRLNRTLISNSTYGLPSSSSSPMGVLFGARACFCSSSLGPARLSSYLTQRLLSAK